MVETLAAARRAAGRETGELTRRDIARALLSVPADEALATLAELRQELTAAGNPLSGTFWDSARSVLSAIQQRDATVGDVHQWLEATGTEPIRMILSEGFLWPEEDERGPVAEEMHGRLVAHLESLVAAGTIDPDRLVAGDQTALADYQRHQVEWLRTPLPDGREPWLVVSDEEDEAFLAAWQEDEAEARQVFEQQLVDLGTRPCPEVAMQAACSRLRADLASDDRRLRLLRTAAGVDPAQLPSDDRELWLALAAGVIRQMDAPPDDTLDDETAAAWSMIDNWEWAGAVLALTRGGPGAVADPVWLAREALAFEPDEDEDFDGFELDDDDLEAGGDEDLGEDLDEFDEDFDDDLDEGLLGEADEDQDELALSIGFFTPVTLWRVLGALDEEDRLTELGWWGLPEALLNAWQPADDKS